MKITTITANTVLHAITCSAAMFGPKPSDYELGILAGQLLVARLIGPADPVLLQEATAAVDALRKSVPACLTAAAPDLLAALRELESVANNSLDMRPEFRRAVSTAYTAIAKATAA